MIYNYANSHTQTVTDECPAGRVITRKGPAPAAKGGNKKDEREITDHFLVHMPSLLVKVRRGLQDIICINDLQFVVEEDKVANLLEILLHVRPELFTATRHDKATTALVGLLEEIVDKNPDSDVLT